MLALLKIFAISLSIFRAAAFVHTGLWRRPTISSRFSSQIDKEVKIAIPNGAVIVGSGPIGLATAIMLSQLGASNIKVIDQLSEPPAPDDTSFWGTFRSERSYNIGITGRGQLVLKDLAIWDDIKPFTAEIYGGATWAPTTPQEKPALSIQNRKYGTHCIERDRLTGCLLRTIRTHYSDKIAVLFNTKCVNLKSTNQNACQNSESWELEFMQDNGNTTSTLNLMTSLVVGTDGSNSVVRDKLAAIDKSIEVYKYDEINEYVYRTVPVIFNLSVVDEFCQKNKSMSYSMRSNVGLNMESLPTVEGVHLGVLLYKPENALIRNITSGEDARQMFDQYFPIASKGISDQAMDRFAKQNNSRFQRFQYVYPNLHFGKSICLLGDSIHTVKPYFGLGVNSGLEDVSALKKAIISQKYDLALAFQQFSQERAKEAKALVSMSQRMDRGFVYFILPLIIDSICHKFAPWLFEKSVVSCMQDESRSFTQILKRKQQDRLLQLTAVSVLSMIIIHSTKLILKNILLPFIFKRFPVRVV